MVILTTQAQHRTVLSNGGGSSAVRRAKTFSLGAQVIIIIFIMLSSYFHHNHHIFIIIIMTRYSECSKILTMFPCLIQNAKNTLRKTFWTQYHRNVHKMCFLLKLALFSAAGIWKARARAPSSLKDLIFCSNATAPTSKIPISFNFIDLCWSSN